MTEDEAKTKWCPFARTVVTIDSTQGGIKMGPTAIAAANRFADDRASLCIASACMAWRWGQTAGEGPFSTDHGTGYCGLAGSLRP